MTIPVVTSETIQVNEEYIGLKGSPTQVTRIFRPKVSRQGERYVIKEEADLEHAVDRFIELLVERQLL